MSVAYASIGAFVTLAESVTLTYPEAPSPGRLAVAVVDSGHPTATVVPSTPVGWGFVGSFVGGGGAYGADAGPRRISLFIRALQGGDAEPTFTIPAGTESRVGGAIVFLSYDAAGQPVIRYQASFGEDTSSGTTFSVTGDRAIVWESPLGQAALLAYVLATDAFSLSAEAITATGITFSAITERADNGSTVGADARRGVATGTITAGGPSAQIPTITATLSGSTTGVAGVLRVEDRGADGGPGTITATYDSALSRVRLAIRLLDPYATHVRIERSVNGVVWKPVRGGFDVPIGLIAGLTDTMTTASVDSWAPADTGQTYTLVGGAAADYDKAAGVGTIALPDLTARHAIASGSFGDVDFSHTVTVPATATGGSYSLHTLARYTDASNWYTLQAVAATDGTVDLFIGRMVAGVFTSLASAADPAIYSPGNVLGLRFRLVGSRLQGKVWNATTGTEPGAWTVSAVDLSFTSGSVGVRPARDAGNTNVGLIPAYDNLVAQTVGVDLDDYEFAADVLSTYRVTAMDDGLVPTDIETVTITPTLDQIWLKSPARPFLNRRVTVVNPSDIGRPNRGQDFDVTSRSYPVAVTELRGSRRFPIMLYVDNAADAQTLEFILAGGDVLFIHTPADCDVPGGYVLVGDTLQRRPAGRAHGEPRVFVLPCTEVAAPGPDVYAASSTWDSILAAFATWDAVLTAFATWDDVLAFVGSPAEVIVP